MQERSIVERGIKDSELIRSTMDEAEQKVFNKIKRSLVRTFVNPNYGVKMLIDLSAMEYIKYIRNRDNADVSTSKTAKTIVDLLSELDLTPKSRRSTEVSKTLSQIFQSVIDSQHTKSIGTVQERVDVDAETIEASGHISSLSEFMDEPVPSGTMEE